MSATGFSEQAGGCTWGGLSGNTQRCSSRLSRMQFSIPPTAIRGLTVLHAVRQSVAETCHLEHADAALPGEFNLRYVLRNDIPRLFATAEQLNQNSIESAGVKPKPSA